MRPGDRVRLRIVSREGTFGRIVEIRSNLRPLWDPFGMDFLGYHYTGHAHGPTVVVETDDGDRFECYPDEIEKAPPSEESGAKCC